MELINQQKLSSDYINIYIDDIKISEIEKQGNVFIVYDYTNNLENNDDYSLIEDKIKHDEYSPEEIYDILSNIKQFENDMKIDIQNFDEFYNKYIYPNKSIYNKIEFVQETRNCIGLI